MRLTLEQLKAMSSRELRELWSESEFPFDAAKPCGQCLTGHHPGYDGQYRCKEHVSLSEQLGRMDQSWGCGGEYLITHLEELYALRLFYDHLYAKEVIDAVEEKEQEKVSV